MVLLTADGHGTAEIMLGFRLLDRARPRFIPQGSKKSCSTLSSRMFQPRSSDASSDPGTGPACRPVEGPGGE
jgi:hypothetical protein